MAAAFQILKKLVLFLVGAFVAAIIAYYVGKYLEKHDLVDVTGAVWGRVMTWVNYLGALLAQQWFWPTFFGLMGFAGGLYLDAFMRRWVASDKKWLSSLKIFDLADPNLMKDAIKAEADNQEIMESIRKFQAEREALMPLAKPPFGSSPIMAESETSEAIRILQASVREASLRSSALLETRERTRMRALDDIYEKLQNGELIAKGLLEPVGTNPKEINIPAEYWRFLKFKSDYKEAEGKGIKFTAIVVAR